MDQEQGLLGRIVGGMIRRSTKARLRNLYWSQPEFAISAPTILYANHHGWLDGYIMFHLVSRLGLVSIDWIEEFDSFPLFSKVGGIRFAKGDVTGRASAIRKTIHLMTQGKCSLVIFPEGVLHRPPNIQKFGRSLEVVARNVPNVTLIPTAIYYEMSIHERPEAWVKLGSPHQFSSLQDCHERLTGCLDELVGSINSEEKFVPLSEGTKNINERFSRRKSASK